MEENNFKHYSHRSSGLTFGFILVLAGAIFLAFNFGLLDNAWRQVVFSWQMLLIIIGLSSMIYRHVMSGLTFVAVGGFFIIPRLAIASPDTFYWVEQNFSQTYWPVLLIVFGILVLLSKIFRPKSCCVNHCSTLNADFRHAKNYSKNYMINSGFERNSVFGNVREIILDPVFSGGDFNAIFGNIMLDLRKTTLPEGETRIELNAVFGGITILVPETWSVELHLDNVFGGFKDSRIISPETDHSRKLIIHGACIFGGGEIKN